MVGIIFYFEESLVNVCSGNHFAWDMFRESTKPWGVDTIITVNKTDMVIPPGDASMNIHFVNTLKEAIDLYPEANFVFIEKESHIPEEIAKTEIKSFIHPDEDVFYVVGPDSNSINPKYMDKGQAVYIRTPSPIPMWSIAALAIVLSTRG